MKLFLSLSVIASITFIKANAQIIKTTLVKSESENPPPTGGGRGADTSFTSDGMWVYLFTLNGNKFISEKLVNMKNHK